MTGRIRRSWRRAVPLLVAGGCAVLVAACGSSSSASSTANSAGSSSGSSSGDAQTVTVALPVYDATFIPVWLAQEEGYYKQQGLNVKIQVYQGGASCTKAVAAGSADLGVNGLGGVMPAVVQGQGIKAVYGGFDEVSYEWIAPKNVTSVKQAASMGWGVTDIGADTDFMTRYLLAKNGIDPTSAKIVQGIVSVPTGLAALGAGRVQVATTARDQAPPYFTSGKYHVLASETQFTNSYPDHVVFAKTGYIASHASTITKFLRALSQAITYEKSHPSQTQAAMTKYTQIPKQFAAASYGAFANQQYADGRLPDAAGMKFFWTVAIQNGEYKAQVPESKWLDPKWIDSYSQWSKQ